MGKKFLRGEDPLQDVRRHSERIQSSSVPPREFRQRSARGRRRRLTRVSTVSRLNFLSATSELLHLAAIVRFVL